MRNTRYKRMALFAGLLWINACAPDEQGFISEQITYSQNPFNVTQGAVALSNAIVSDGSTLPLHVKLIGIRNKVTGAVATEFTQNYETTVYLSEITQQDTTFDMVKAKIKKESWPVFRINEVGGQLQFSPETVNVPVGEYTFDVEVSNDSGTKIFKDICTVRVNAGNPIPNIAAQVLTFEEKTDEEGNKEIVTNYPEFDVNTTYETSVENSITFRFVDKDGEMIDPVKYGFKELVRESANDYKFSDATPWHDGNPKNISADGIVYEFPVGPFPYSWIQDGKSFRFSYLPSGTAATEFKNKTGLLGFDVKLYTSSFKIRREGAYVVTVTCKSIDI